MAEARILAHMNADHMASVEDYLVAYGNVTLDDKVSDIQMSEIDLNHFSITFKHADSEKPTVKAIPFDPPMESLKEARTRLVEMAKVAAKKRGFSPFQIKEYKFPGPVGQLSAFILYAPLISTVYPKLLDNSVVKTLLSQSKIDTVVRNGLNITYGILLIHLAEIALVTYPKLLHYRVPLASKIKWCLSNFVEGFPTILRFNKVVAEKDH